MTVQTIETQGMNTIQNLFHYASMLSEDGLRKLAEQAQRLAEDEEIPNTETIAAMREIDEGGGEEITLEELRAEINALC